MEEVLQWQAGLNILLHRFLAMIIGPNDEINDSHQMRAEDNRCIETIKQENERLVLFI